MKFKNFLISIILRLLLVNIFLNKLTVSENQNKVFPIILSTWDSKLCADAAWETLYNNKSAIDAIEKGCSVCEEILFEGTVGFGKHTDEKGEVTLDAMLMDGVTMDVGAVGSLRRVKSAISVARRVLENTEHSLLVGEQATDFAVEMGFKAETHMPKSTVEIWKKWKDLQCQPNHRKNVSPDPKRFCGPYKPSNEQECLWKNIGMGEENHDTVGMVAIDSKGHIAAGTSTNGMQYKIPGRVGDSPIPGSGAFADQEVGAAAGTGDGDIMLRFVPSFLAVELMRNGATPDKATEEAIRRIAKYYPKFMGAVIAVNKNGDFGAACNGIESGSFNYHVSNPTFKEPKMMWVPCIDSK